jgi:hypothetical protein
MGTQEEAFQNSKNERKKISQFSQRGKKFMEPKHMKRKVW